MQVCVEQQVASAADQEPALSAEPSSDQENSSVNIEQVVLPVRPYATRSAVAAAAAAQEAAKEAAAALQADEKAPPKAPAAARRLSARSAEHPRSVSDGDGAGAGAGTAWDALCAEMLTASEALAVSRVVRSETSAAE